MERVNIYFKRVLFYKLNHSNRFIAIYKNSKIHFYIFMKYFKSNDPIVESFLRVTYKQVSNC